MRVLQRLAIGTDTACIYAPVSENVRQVLKRLPSMSTALNWTPLNLRRSNSDFLGRCHRSHSISHKARCVRALTNSQVIANIFFANGCGGINLTKTGLLPTLLM